MQLRDYLLDTRIGSETAYARYKRFGKSIGVSMDCVRKWCYQQRHINDSMKWKIVDATGGKVKIVDMMW